METENRNEIPESLRPTTAAAFLNGPVFGAVARGGEAYGRALLGWQNELLRFAGARLRSDTEFGRSLVGCRDWMEAARLQQSWLNAVVQDYVEETGRLLRLATTLGGEFDETAREETEEVAARGAEWTERARSEMGRSETARSEAGRSEAGRAAAQPRPRRRQRG
jgi:hypothetical protein